MILRSIFLLAFKSLFSSKVRFLITVSGVALAILLILTLKGIEKGSLRQSTVYVDKSAADIFVIQKGNRDIFRATSILPRGMEEVIKTIKGVREVTGVVQGATNFKINGKEGYLVYFGFDPQTGVGGPWDVISGSKNPNENEVILDQVLARKLGIKIGDTIIIRSLSFKVSGLSDHTVTVIGSFAFFTKDDALRIMRLSRVVNHFQVFLEERGQEEEVIERIESLIPDIAVFSKEQFRQNHLDVVYETLIPPMEVMVLISLLIGTIIIGLTIYTMTESRKKEYGILKAIGVKNRRLYLIVLLEAAVCAFFGFFLSVIFTLATTKAINLLVPEVEVIIEPALLIKIFGLSFLMSSLAALIPARLVAKVDPVIIFRE